MSSFSIRTKARIACRFGQNPLGHPLGQRFQQVQPFGREFCRDGFGDAVIGQDAVNVILQRLRLPGALRPPR
jgi:hypothetical protein